MPDVYGPEVLAVPSVYLSEFLRSPADALLQYGSAPQRAKSPFFTATGDIDAALVLPDRVTGPGSEALEQPQNSIPEGWEAPRTLIAHRDPRALMDGLDPEFYAPADGSLWHVAYDLALNTRRKGDRAGFAIARIADVVVETDRDPASGSRYERVMRTFEVPLVAQIAAPVDQQIYLTSIVRFILMLKAERGFNITSFSGDGFQSADAAQQLVLAGLVTAGMSIDRDSGLVVGTPRPFSVDRTPAPYNELLEAAADHRVVMPRYSPLRHELRTLMVPEPGRAPDHPPEGSKDTSDAVASAIGYLAAFGHHVMPGAGAIVTRSDMEAGMGLEETPWLGVDGEQGGWDDGDSVDLTLD